ncbi:hypothetical protein PIIN_03095 [Serendipita indica DSM 11827]|uniref:Uncharacterized protein n=1 Tax=Serendipita indica (strain DSM 11827) TaxID=1109443 RepID=G4TCZ8_SERID|nr:hypothetical protein PIIN_03095 [Serendipita indica DSM 11827]
MFQVYYDSPGAAQGAQRAVRDLGSEREPFRRSWTTRLMFGQNATPRRNQISTANYSLSSDYSFFDLLK